MTKPKEQPQAPIQRRPVLQFRVHPDIYQDLKQSAARAKLTISEEAARRLERYAEYENAFKSAEKILSDTRLTVANDLEAALRQAGYIPVLIDQGRVWAEPGVDVSRLSLSIDAAAIVKAIEPDLIRAVSAALQQIAKGERT